MRALHRLYLTLLPLGITLCCQSALAQYPAKNANELLGYPADAKLLIIHADDLALAHTVNRASLEALEAKAITSGSIMVPCPWLTEVAAYARSHPGIDLGLHLTLTSEWKTYRWAPVWCAREVPGLLDTHGYLWADSPLVVKNAKPDEVEREIRGQIEKAIKAGFDPTHLDSHMGTLFSPIFFPVYLKLAREYRLPFFMVRTPNPPPLLAALFQEGDILVDHFAMATEGVKPEQWSEYYLNLAKALKPGLTELIVHLGYDDAELQAISVDHPAYGSAWRQRDLQVIRSPEFRKALEENKIVTIGWKDIKKAWFGR